MLTWCLQFKAPSFWISREIWSPEVMCWTVVKESLLLCSPNIPRGYQAACCTVHSTYWSVINHSHLGTVGCVYCIFFCDCGIWNTRSPWMSHRGFFPRLDLCSTLFVSQHILLKRETLTSVTNHPHTSFTLHTPPSLTLLILLSLFAKYSVVPGSPQRQAAGGHAQQQPLSSPETGWRHCSPPRWFCDTHQHIRWYIASSKEWTVRGCRRTQTHLLFMFEKPRGVLERVRTSDANNRWSADGRVV